MKEKKNSIVLLSSVQSTKKVTCSGLLRGLIFSAAHVQQHAFALSSDLAGGLGAGNRQNTAASRGHTLRETLFADCTLESSTIALRERSGTFFFFSPFAGYPCSSLKCTT